MSSDYPFGMEPDPEREDFEKAGAELHRRVFPGQPVPNLSEPAGETIMVEGQAFGTTEYADLSDIIARGELIELKARQAVMKRAGLHGHDMAPEAIEVRWKLEVNAIGWPRPQFLKDRQADVDRDLDEERAAMRAVLEEDGAPESVIDRMLSEMQPSSDLVQILEEAEASWQGALRQAAEGYLRHFPYSVPANRTVEQP